jgi:DNA polymerase V
MLIAQFQWKTIASSLLENSRVIARSRLVGGHSAGGLEGLK